MNDSWMRIAKGTNGMELARNKNFCDLYNKKSRNG